MCKPWERSASLPACFGGMPICFLSGLAHKARRLAGTALPGLASLDVVAAQVVAYAQIQLAVGDRRRREERAEGWPLADVYFEARDFAVSLRRRFNQAHHAILAERVEPLVGVDH